MFLNFCLCLCSNQRTPETRRTACCVKVGLRAFAERRETQERSTVCSHPTSLICPIYPQKASQDPLRESLGPEWSSQGCRGLILTVNHAQNFYKELKGTNISSTQHSLLDLNKRATPAVSFPVCLLPLSLQQNWLEHPTTTSCFPPCHTCVVGTSLGAFGPFQWAPRE